MDPKYKRHSTPRNMITYGRIISHITERAIKAGFGHKQGGAYEGKVNLRKLQSKTGISRPTLFYLLRYPETFARIDVHTLARLCFALDCDVGDLMSYERFPSPDTKGLGTKYDDIDELDGVE